MVVTKQDGTVERFSLAKLSNCLANGLRAQHYDPRLAGPLANAVALHIQEWRESAPPTTGYIYRCVRAVLQQTGLSDVADELAEHRQQRRARRQTVRVLTGGRNGTSSDRNGPACELWNKGALVRALESGYGVRHAVARILARQIESQVFALDYRVVTKSFLRELVHNEVLAWGLGGDSLPGGSPLAAEPLVARPRPQEEN